MALKPKITRELLRKNIGDFNIFHFYFGPIELNKSYKSVFREEARASTGFFLNDKGELVYNDFATCEKYDFVHFVMKLFNINFYKALERIAIDFELIPGERSTAKPATIQAIEAAKVTKKKKFTIDVIKLQKRHLQYWEQYAITKQELLANNIQAVSGITIDDWTVPTTVKELKFLYTFADGENKYFKIYSPHSTDYKWTSSCPLSLPFGLNDLHCTNDTLFITKSVKDCLVLRKFFPEVIALQNESKDALKKETARALKKCYKQIYIWFDCDKTGIFAASWYKEHYGFTPIFTPEKLYEKHGVKDPADFVKQCGLETFKIYLHWLKLI